MSPKRRRSHSHSQHKPHRQAPFLFRVIKKIFVSALFLGILSLIGFGFFWWMGDSLFQLEDDANIVFVSSNLDGSESKIFFVQFLKEEQRITVQSVQPQQSVDVIGGYGQYQLLKVYPLLKLEKKDSTFTKAAMSWAMGNIVDQIIVLEASEPTSKGRLVSILGSQLYRQGLSLENTKRLAELYFFARSTPDELVSISPDAIELEKLTDALYQSVNDDCAVAVVNTTQVPRMATRISSILESSGVAVVRLDDSTTDEASMISVNPTNLSCKGIAGRMKAIFPFAVDQVDQPEVRQEHRADLVLMLGSDLGEVVAE